MVKHAVIKSRLTLSIFKFVDDKLNGKGQVRGSNGDIQKGIYVDDLLEGEGFWSNKIGEKYYGQF